MRGHCCVLPAPPAGAAGVTATEAPGVDTTAVDPGAGVTATTGPDGGAAAGIMTGRSTGRGLLPTPLEIVAASVLAENSIHAAGPDEAATTGVGISRICITMGVELER